MVGAIDRLNWTIEHSQELMLLWVMGSPKQRPKLLMLLQERWLVRIIHLEREAQFPYSTFVRA